MSILRSAGFCLALALVVLGATLTVEAQVARIGEPETIELSTPHPYPAAAGSAAKEWVIQYPGATYIRVHFSRFDLAPGDYVEIQDPDGRRWFRFEGRGPHGTGEFWAFTVPGDTAVIRLQAFSGGGYGFDVDQFGRGTVPIFDDPVSPPPNQPESVCGSQDWQDVECYRDSYPTEFDKARGAVKAIIGCCSSCTAFKVSDSGQFMTNNHCTSTDSGVKSTELQMEYQRTSCGGTTSSDSGSVMGDTLLRTDYTLDYTLFTSVGNSDHIPCLEIDPRLAPVGERIYIAGHPSGGVKKLSIESDINGGLCQVDASPYSGRGSDSDIGYYCDTTNGSSGSPVLSGDSHKVVAIHHFGGCLNSGARMDRIHAQISGLLDACTGGGGGGDPVCGNGIKESGEECDGSDFGGDSCQSRGFDGGDLACNADCTVDDSGCFNNACLPKGSACSTDSECCSNKCRGGRKGKLCR